MSLKLLLSFAVMLTVILSSYSSGQASAKEVNHQSSIKTEQELISEHLEQGLSLEDSVYYAKLTKMIDEAERTGKEFNLDDAPTVEIQNSYARNHKDEFRKRILNGDTAALKKAFLSLINIKENGFKDLQKLQEADKQRGELQNTYTVIYPDGSKLTATSFKEKRVNTENSDIQKNADETHLPGPWNESYEDHAEFIYGDGDERNQDYIGGYEWWYETGVNIARVKVILEWTHTMYGVEPYFVDGSEYYSGVLQKETTDSVYRGNVDYREQNPEHYIQGYHDVEVAVSGAFTGDFLNLGIELGAGAQWHQYSIVEIDALNSLHCYYGQYSL